MHSQLNPYVNFNGNAREAMEFYHGILGGELTMNTFGEFNVLNAPADGIMHAMISVDGKSVLMGSDGMDGGQTHTGFSMSLSGTDSEELQGYFTKLSDGGNVTMPLAKQAWGDEFGMVTDKFGLSWMVNIGQQS